MINCIFIFNETILSLIINTKRKTSNYKLKKYINVYKHFVAKGVVRRKSLPVTKIYYLGLAFYNERVNEMRRGFIHIGFSYC